MNNIIPLPQIISQLAQLTDCDVATARKFLHEFFAMIESSLIAGESIQIKGIGTFSRSENLAEPVVFVPDSDLADAINTPFAMFEAIPLEDGIDDNLLNDIVGESEQKSESVVLEQQEDIATDVVLTNSEVAEPVQQDNQLQSDDNQLGTVEDKVDESRPEAVDPEQEHKEEVESISEEPEVVIAKVESTCQDECLDKEEQVHNKNENGPVKLVIAFIIGLICGFLVHYLIDFGLASKGDVNKDIDSVPLPEQPLSVDTAVEEKVAEVGADTTLVTSEASSEKKATEPIYDTITDKRFLTTMAKQYYGRRDFWVYIYQANRDIIDDPNMIKVGTKVRIPDKEEFSSGLSSKECIDKAHAIAAEVYAKYKQH
jgi:hypothetical protein